MPMSTSPIAFVNAAHGAKEQEKGGERTMMNQEEEEKDMRELRMRVKDTGRMQVKRKQR